jgi:hypothetical protein
MPGPRRVVTDSAFVAPAGLVGPTPRRGIARRSIKQQMLPLVLPFAATATLGALLLNPYPSAQVAVGATATATAQASASVIEVDGESVLLTSRSRIVVPAGTPSVSQDAAAVAALSAAAEAAAAEVAAAEEAAVEKAAVEKAAAEKAASRTYAAASKYGLRGGAVKTYEAVMSRFSGINSVGGYRASSLSNHQLGLAIDFMLTPGEESSLGWSIAKYLAANASALNIDHIIFEQHIWTPSSPTWRLMEDRGGITANHFDHVHVSMKS